MLAPLIGFWHQLSVAPRAALTLWSVALAAAASSASPELACAQALFVPLTALTCLLALGTAHGALTRAFNRTCSWLPRTIVLLGMALTALALLKVSGLGFSRADEIYSWNLWALQHVMGETPELRYTQAPYPQLFPHWLASIYQAQGQTVAQFLPRSMTVIPLLLVLLLPVDLADRPASRPCRVAFLVFYLAMAGAIINHMHWGYADPLMTAALATGLALLLSDLQTPRLGAVLLAAGCFAMAAWTKQPGMLWAVLCFPLLTLWGIHRLAWPRHMLGVALGVFLAGLIWPLGWGEGFMHNQGVISRSLADRAPLQTFLSSAHAYLILKPEVGLLVVGSAVLAWLRTGMGVVWLVTVVPLLIAWFVFGSYELRLGMHVIVFCALLGMHLLGPEVSVAPPRAKSFVPGPAPQLAALVLLTGLLAWNVHQNAGRAADGQRVAFEKQFGPHAAGVFDRMVAEGQVVMTTSHFHYGLFFGRLPVQHLHPQAHPRTPAEMRDWLLTSGAAYVIESGAWAFGPYDALLQSLLAQCPEAFESTFQSALEPSFRIHRVQPARLKAACAA